MANIELKIVALGDFSSVNTQLKALQAQVDALKKNIAGVGLNSQLTSQLRSIQSEFKATMLSSGQFTAHTVQLTSETEKFGKALESGKLRLSDYYSIITRRSGEAQKSVKALAIEQVKLNNSLVVEDITKKGVYSVYTPNKINEIAKATEIAAAKQTIFNIAVQQGSQKLIDWGKNTQWAGRQLTVGMAVPLMLFGSQAMKTFKEVNDELVRLQKVYGSGITQPTTQALAQIKQQVTALTQELARTMGTAAKDTAEMAADLAATGLQGVELINSTREAMRLQKLGEMDTQSAMQTTISLQNVYKLSTKELSGAVNFLNAVENQTSTSLQDLADGIPKVGPIVQQLGGSFKDTAIMMVAMKEAGVPAAQSANAIKSALSSLISPTKAAREAFAEYNIDLASIASKSNGNPIQMITMLQQSIKGLGTLPQAQLIDKLFGKYQFARIQALIANLGTVNSQTKTAFDLANASAPQLAALAASELKVATESTTGKFKRAIETLKSELLPVGEKIMQVATSLLNFGNSVANFFQKLPGPIKNGLGILAALAALAGPVIMLTGLFANFTGYIVRTVFNIAGLITGTRKFSELFTPAAIAAKHSTDVFNSGLIQNVSSIDLLNGAISRLTVNLEGLAMSMNATTGAGMAGVIATAEAAVASAASKKGFKQMKLPGMAEGGYVPGSGDSDSYPAMLMPGEAVIPKGPAEKYRPFINSMIQGTLPGYAYGIVKAGKYAGQKVSVERGHATPDHSSSIFDAINTPSMLQMAGLSSLQSVTKGSMIGMPGLVNQRTKEGNAGISAAAALEEYTKMIDAGIDPMENLKNNALKLGAKMEEVKPKLDSAFSEFMDGLRAASMDPTHPGFGKRKGQIPFEQFSSGFISPATYGISTPIGGSLGNVMDRVVGTRGVRSSGKKGGSATAGTFYMEESGQIVPFGKSSMSGTLSENDVATKSSYSMSNVFKRVSSRSKKVLGINSPSKMFEEEIGKPISEGVAKGIIEGAPLVESAMESTVGDKSNIQSRFGKAFGAGSRLRSMTGSTMGRMGLAMGGTMALQMASPMLEKMPGGSAVSGALSGASMGMAFGPWGAAAGAAISLTTMGIKHLMEVERQHKLESESSFKSSADAVEFLGAAVADATHKMSQFKTASVMASDSAGEIGHGVTYTNGELDKFKSMVNSLPKDNPLAVIVNQMKEASNGAGARRIAESFAQTQMAINGISKDQADKLMQLMLTMSGHSASGARVSAKDQLTAITSTINSSLGNAKQFAQFIGQISDISVNTSSWQQYKNILDGIGKSAATSGQLVKGLIDYLQGIGDFGGASLVSQLQTNGYSASEILTLNKAVQAGMKLNAKDYKPGDTKKFAELAAQAIKLQADAEKAKTSATNAGVAASNASSAASNAKIKQLQAEKKAIDATIKSMEDALRAQQNQANFDQSRTDLKQQILMARANGDNLKAQLLQQQLFSKSSDFKAQSAIDEKKAQSDSLAQQIADLQEKANAPLTSATTSNTKATDKNTGALGAKDGQTGGSSGQGGIEGLSNIKHKDVGADFGTTSAQAKQKIDAMQASGLKIPDFKGQWSKEYTDPETGIKSQALTTDAMRYVVNYGNGGKGYEKGDQFMFDQKVYEVKTGASALGTAEAVIVTGTAAMTGSGGQRFPSSSPFPMSLKDLKALTEAYNTKNGYTKAKNPAYYLEPSNLFSSGNKFNSAFSEVWKDNSLGLKPGAHFNYNGQKYRVTENGAPIRIAAKERGGSVSKNTPYLVGEKGPEIFAPGAGGFITPSNMLAPLLSGLSRSSALGLGAAKSAMVLPKALSPLLAMSDGIDIPQNTLASAQSMRNLSNNATIGNNYHVNINIDKVDSSVDIERAVNNAFIKVKQQQGMSGTSSSRVGG